MTATCPKCGYEWQTRSKLDRVTCPNCHRKLSLPASVIEPIGPPIGVTERCDVCGRPVNTIQPCRIDGEAAFVCNKCLARLTT
jgi:hypothetical protein